MSKNLKTSGRKIEKLRTFGAISVGSQYNHYDGLIPVRIWGVFIVNFWPKNHTNCRKIEKFPNFSISKNLSNFSILRLKTFTGSCGGSAASLLLWSLGLTLRVPQIPIHSSSFSLYLVSSFSLFLLVVNLRGPLLRNML